MKHNTSRWHIPWVIPITVRYQQCFTDLGWILPHHRFRNRIDRISSVAQTVRQECMTSWVLAGIKDWLFIPNYYNWFRKSKNKVRMTVQPQPSDWMERLLKSSNAYADSVTYQCSLQWPLADQTGKQVDVVDRFVHRRQRRYRLWVHLILKIGNYRRGHYNWIVYKLP